MFWLVKMLQLVSAAQLQSYVKMGSYLEVVAACTATVISKWP